MRYSLIPDELRALDRWVCAWRDSKCPMKAFDRSAAGVSDPDSWADFDCARVSVLNGAYDDIGFVLAGDGYVGIDVDDGFDSDGFLTAEACDIITRFGSYTEASRSGRGFHIFVKGTLPEDGYNNRAGKEIYQNGRYFITTGRQLTPDGIRENQPAIDWYLATYMKDLPAETPGAPRPRQYSPVWQRAGERIPLHPDYPPIGQGGRNVSLLSLGGSLRETGYSLTQLYKELLYANARACEPPLSRMEVKAVAESCMRYKR